jgi:hypothetical protein
MICGCLVKGRRRATLSASASSWRRAVLSLVLAAGSAVEGMGASPADVRRLEAAQQITRELKSGDEHSYEVVLAADQYVEVVAEQQSINLALVLVGPNGQKLMEVDTAKSKNGTELLARIAETAGTYRIDVRVVGKNAAPGGYRITLRALRTPTALDRVLEQARRLAEESRSLRAKGAYGEALTPGLAALALREQALGADDVLVGDSLHVSPCCTTTPLITRRPRPAARPFPGFSKVPSARPDDPVKGGHASRSSVRCRAI